MKLSILTLAVLAAVLCSAGCVSSPHDIIGTWTSEDISGLPVPSPDVTRIIVEFTPDRKGTETWVYANGCRYVSNISWIENDDGTFSYAYDSWLTTVSENGTLASDEEGRVFVREGSDADSGYPGTWTAVEAYEYNGMLYTITNEIYPDNTGVSIWTDQNGVTEPPWEMVWYPYKEDMYINYYKEALIGFTILDNGTGLDSYNLTYTKA